MIYSLHSSNVIKLAKYVKAKTEAAKDGGSNYVKLNKFTEPDAQNEAKYVKYDVVQNARKYEPLLMHHAEKLWFIDADNTPIQRCTKDNECELSSKYKGTKWFKTVTLYKVSSLQFNISAFNDRVFNNDSFIGPEEPKKDNKIDFGFRCQRNQIIFAINNGWQFKDCDITENSQYEYVTDINGLFYIYK